MPREPSSDPLFKIELWSDDDQMLIETLATASTWALAKAAFQEAQRQYPGKAVVIRQGIRVVARPQ